MSRPPKKGRINRPSSENDGHQLWKAWAESITPFKTGKGRVRLGNDKGDEPASQSPPEIPPAKGTPANTGPPANSKNHNPAAHQAHKTRSNVPHRVPQLADFDHKSRRRLGSGRIEIAARLDLHGMRQNEAHAALHGFLCSAQARGLRWVLVITGKGAPANDRGNEQHEPWLGSGGGQGRGILRRLVPQWLAEPEYRAVVVSHTTAAPHHGGEGARYVQLRARARRT